MYDENLRRNLQRFSPGNQAKKNGRSKSSLSITGVMKRKLTNADPAKRSNHEQGSKGLNHREVQQSFRLYHYVGCVEMTAGQVIRGLVQINADTRRRQAELLDGSPEKVFLSLFAVF